MINTGTTIVTFLMVFLIQNTQNRDTEAIQLKLDELIRVRPGAHNALLDLEELNEDELEHVRQRYEDLASEARRQLKKGAADTDQPELMEPFVEAAAAAKDAAARARRTTTSRRRAKKAVAAPKK